MIYIIEAPHVKDFMYITNTHKVAMMKKITTITFYMPGGVPPSSGRYSMCSIDLLYIYQKTRAIAHGERSRQEEDGIATEDGGSEHLSSHSCIVL